MLATLLDSIRARLYDFQQKMKSENMNQPAYCIFLDTVCEGRIPAWHDEKGMPVVYPTLGAAQREIADDVMEKLRQFLEGQRDFEDAMTVEDYILPVDVLPDGSVLDEDGNYFGKKEV
jgi:hypothetical protein